MKITLNLATRPYTDIGPALKRLRIAIAVLAVMAIGSAWACAPSTRKPTRLARIRTARAEQDRRHQPGTEGYQEMMRQPANARLLKEVGMLNQLFDQKTFSWTLAMEDLENVVPGGVQVATLEPTSDEKTGRTTVKLRVVGPRDRADDRCRTWSTRNTFCCRASWAKVPRRQEARPTGWSR